MGFLPTYSVKKRNFLVMNYGKLACLSNVYIFLVMDFFAWIRICIKFTSKFGSGENFFRILKKQP